MAKKLIVEIVGDSRSYERALNRSATSTQQFGQAMGTTSPKLGKLSSTLALTGTSMTLMAGAAAGLAVTLGAKAVAAASDLNEQISRTEVVLGKAAKETIAWSETTATSMGISQRAALAAVGTFAGLFQTVGIARAPAADLSKTLVKLAADLASLQNTNPEEALIALRSGLAGEAEPLRRYNIFLTETRVAQQAMIDTGKDSARQLTQQEKITARYNIIMKDSVLAQGNFALTSGEMANQQRIARAEMDNLSASAGQALVPAMDAAFTTMGLFAGSLNDAIKGMGKLKGFFEDTTMFDGWNSAIEGATTSTTGFFEGVRDSIPFMERFLELRGSIVGRADSGGPSRGGIPGDISRRRDRDAIAAAKAEVNAKIAQTKRGQSIIDRITKDAQKNLSQQLADSEARAAHIRDLIRTDPENAKLQQRLTAELKKQDTLRKGIASAAETAARADRTAAAAARADAEAAKAARREATRERKERERDRAERKRDAAKAAQFKALGLTGEGERPTPGSGSLLKRALSLQDQVKGTALDTPKTRSQLQRIVEFLRKNFKKAGKDVRAAILDMLNTISGAGDEKKGPLTKGAGLNTKKVLEGLGLTPEQIRELRGRLSSVSGTAGGGAIPKGPTLPRGAGTMTTGAGFVVESHTTINLDGQQVANVVTKQQQRQRRRNPSQKRGPNRRGI